MLHPDTELRFISDTVGHGVVATRPIPKGTITWVLDRFDQRFHPDAVAAMDPIHRAIVDKYTFRQNTGEYILCWDHARFINHSFRPNCVTTAYDFELAVRDIAPGEQLTDDYGFLNIDEPFDCEPEPGIHDTTVHPDDLLRSFEKWDRLLEAAFTLLADVKQPLFPLLARETRMLALAIAAGDEQMESIRSCYYERPAVAAPVRAARISAATRLARRPAAGSMPPAETSKPVK